MSPSQPESYEPDYYDPLLKAEEDHFWFKGRNQIIEAVLCRIKLFPGNNPSILEVGCGNGNVLRVFEKVYPAETIIGMDLYFQGLHHARQRVNCALLQGEILQFPFQKQFRLIGLFDVLEHLQDDLKVLSSLHQFISDEGYLFLTVPAMPVLWSYFDVAGHHQRRYLKKDLEEKIEASGYQIVISSYFMFILFPIVWLRRRFGKNSTSQALTYKDGENLTLAELKIYPILNEVISWLLSLENWLIMHGFRFPAGTSLIVLAKKKPT